jgi:hypothetical protein
MPRYMYKAIPIYNLVFCSNVTKVVRTKVKLQKWSSFNDFSKSFSNTIYLRTIKKIYRLL